MTRRQFSRKFKLEAVRLVKERGVSVIQASRGLDVGKSLFRRWLKEFGSDPEQAFPGQVSSSRSSRSAHLPQMLLE